MKTQMERMKGTLYVAVGIPASGKSTYGSKLKNASIVCPDAIRKELYGDESIQGDGREVFSIAHKRAQDLLCSGKDVFFDATSVSYRARKSLLERLAAYAEKCIAVYFDTPETVCRERNASRERIVPDTVMDSMAARLTKPRRSEGFSKIIVVHAKHQSKEELVQTVEEWWSAKANWPATGSHT